VKILITGNEGVVGSIIQPRLEDMGHNILGFDLKRFTDESIHDTDYLTHQLSQDIDACIHLAGIPGPNQGTWDQLQRENINGTQSVIRACEKAGVKRLVYASSGAVYGMTTGQMDIQGLPLKEDNPYGPEDTLDNYDKSKIVCEEHLERANIPTVIALRLETPLPHATPVAHHLWAQISPDNLAEAFRAALEADFTGYGAFNIGDPYMKKGIDGIEYARKNYPDVPCILKDTTEPLYCIDKAVEVLGYNPK